MVRAYRNGSAHVCEDGDEFASGLCIVRGGVRDDMLPLCHNSSALECAYWEPGSFDWTLISFLAELVVFLIMMAVLIALAVSCDALAMGVLAIALTIVGAIGIVAAGQMMDFMGNTQVDKEYVSYQGCRRHCDILSSSSAAFAAINQCEDNGTACNIDAGVNQMKYCVSCQSHKGAYVWLEYASSIVRAKAWFYVVLWLFIIMCDTVMGPIGNAAVVILMVLNIVLSLVTCGFVTEGGQRQVMRYVLSTEGDTLYSLLISVSILEIFTALGWVRWINSDMYQSYLKKNKKSGYDALHPAIEPADISNKGR
jgi:hypothetical protein